MVFFSVLFFPCNDQATTPSSKQRLELFDFFFKTVLSASVFGSLLCVGKPNQKLNLV